MHMHDLYTIVISPAEYSQLVDVHMCACVCVYNTMEPVYYGHFRISQKCPDYQVRYPDFPGHDQYHLGSKLGV